MRNISSALKKINALLLLFHYFSKVSHKIFKWIHLLYLYQKFQHNFIIFTNNCYKKTNIKKIIQDIQDNKSCMREVDH